MSGIERREIVVGDVVFCADYDEEERDSCWVNGQTVLEIIMPWGPRAVCTGGQPGHSHKLAYLRHEDEPPFTLLNAP